MTLSIADGIARMRGAAGTTGIACVHRCPLRDCRGARGYALRSRSARRSGEAYHRNFRALSPPKTITVNEIEIGKHGLIVERGPFRGLLLPQVAAERGWSAERFLAETCLKAGLPGDAWKSSETRIFGFTAEVFSEPNDGGRAALMRLAVIILDHAS